MNKYSVLDKKIEKDKKSGYIFLAIQNLNQ